MIGVGWRKRLGTHEDDGLWPRVGKLPLQGENKETDTVGRACLQEADEVKLIIVYIYWGLKKGEDKTDQNKASIASKYPSQ